ncbi:TPA: hypothetical protein N0F65_000687 [Lagenidium giganteum]|uniref:Chromo domain-containing protein n=1 Tax=Lagenidium giganteum TaxID=4803 RepID=A0AAV2YY96_9STRA|nr:TPA: hypothetical protein N0F65_000687 [Lagenidium giganteum]
MMKQRQRPTLAYKPQANGKQERSVQTGMRAVKMYVEHQADWDEYVPRLEFALNSSISLQHGYSAFYLVHRWGARAQLEAIVPAVDGSVKEVEAQKCRKSVGRLHEHAMKHAHNVQVQLVREHADKPNIQVRNQTARNAKLKYKEEQLVWLYYSSVKPGLSTKLAHSWHGPYKVKEIVSDFAYKLHIDARDSRYSWEPDNALGEYEVEAVLDDKAEQTTRGGRMQRKFLIKQKGYDDPQWIAEDDLSCGTLLYEYSKHKRQQARMEAAQHADEDDDLTHDDISRAQ